jgi:molybdate transport system substrate-binding protein
MNTRLRGCLAIAACVGAAIAGSACSGSSGPRSGHGKLTVFAASSLTDAFTAEGDAFRKKTGTTVTFSFAGSQDLVAQIQNGAPADVLATADPATMDTVSSSLDGASRTFAHNTLVIVVAPGNPRHVRRLGDLEHVSVVLGDPTVPAGKYAAQALAAAHVTVHPKSFELEVRSVLTKVELGEVDAGIVYATDARSAGPKVASVPIADSPLAVYPIGALTSSGKAFADFVLSAPGAAIMHRFGFLPP